MAKEDSKVEKSSDNQVYIWSTKLSAKELEQIEKFVLNKSITPIQELQLSIERRLTDEDIKEIRLQIQASSEALGKALNDFLSIKSSKATPSIDMLREGLDRSEIDRVAAIVDLTKKEMAGLLGRSERNRYYTTSKKLSLLESEHLVDLELLFNHGLMLFDGNTKSFSNWLRSPKQALAVPETGFPISLPTDYRQPTLDELFESYTEEQNRSAIKENMAYNQSQITQQNKPFPTPLSILDSPTGVRLVNGILGRIEAGVYS